MTDEEREKVKAKAIPMEITENDLKSDLDKTNPLRLFFKSKSAYGMYKNFWRYNTETKEEVFDLLDAKGLTEEEVEMLIGYNSSLKIKGKPFMGDMQVQWMKEWLDMHQGKSKTGKRGRPKTTFANMMIGDDNRGRLAIIHEMMKGKKGKGVALVILACMNLGWLLKPTFRQVEDEFGDVGTKQAFNNVMAKRNDTKEIHAVEEAIKRRFTEIDGRITFDVVEEI